MSLFGKKEAPQPSVACEQIARICKGLKEAKTRGELGAAIAVLVLKHSPAEIQRMKQKFETKIQNLSPEYRDRLSRKITEHLLGTFQQIRLDDQQGRFKTLGQPVTEEQKKYWDMVAGQCREYEGSDVPALRFLKYLMAGYVMLVQHEPGHPVGTPFPGGDQVQCIEGIYYCPVREKANDVDAALCPFCPALQSPEIGYLKPPVNASEHRKQEFIRNCHEFHNFNG